MLLLLLLSIAASACSRHETHAASSRDAWLSLPDGPTLHYVERGPSDGEPVLLLHGYTDSSHSFSLLLPLLPQQLRCIAVDLRGHGRSAKHLAEHGVDAFVGDAIGLLDALGIARATIVGHSLGSVVAQELAFRHPDRVRRLVLLGATTRGANPVTEALLAQVTRLDAAADPEFVADFQRSTLHAPVPVPFFEQVCADSRRVPATIWRQTLADLMRADTREKLPQIPAPTCIVWGAHDAVFPREEQDALHTGLPRAELHVLPDAGHAPHWERPHEVAAIVARFVAATAGGG